MTSDWRGSASANARNQLFFAYPSVAETDRGRENPFELSVSFFHRRKPMPTVAWFYGILIQMHYDDHVPPHFHARYAGSQAMVRISDGAIIAGDLPPTAARMVREWALARNGELQDNWRRAVVHQSLEKIAGPDDDE